MLTLNNLDLNILCEQPKARFHIIFISNPQVISMTLLALLHNYYYFAGTKTEKVITLLNQQVIAATTHTHTHTIIIILMFIIIIILL